MIPLMDEKQEKLAQYSAWITAHGGKRSSIRLMIAERAFSFGQRFDAEQLMAALRHNCKISRPAVYRTLAEIVRCGVIRCVVEDGRAVFE